LNVTLSMATREGRDLVTIAASGHGTPSPLASSRGVAKKDPAMPIGTGSQPGALGVRQDFSARARNGGQQPLERVLARYEFYTAPAAVEG